MGYNYDDPWIGSEVKVENQPYILQIKTQYQLKKKIKPKEDNIGLQVEEV